MEAIHLDNNATTRPDPRVVESLLPWLGERYGNPSSSHTLGDEAAQAVRRARASVARLLGCDAGEIVFTSGGTESIHSAIHAALRSAGRAAGGERSARTRIVTSTAEHSATLETLAELEREGSEIVRVPVDGDGRVVRAELARALAEPAALCTLILASNETGVVDDLGGVADLCRARGIAFHVDLVQAAGKLPIDVRALGADMASLSAHKFHGPKGIGALFVRRGFHFAPLFRGGGQETGLRAGTENVPGIVGLGQAADLAREFASDPARIAQLATLRDRLEHGLQTAIPGVLVHGARSPRIANTSNLAFPGVEGEALLMLLSEQGVYASAGSACHARARKPSHVLLAMGIGEDEAARSLRFSLSRETTAAEVERALGVVVESVRLLQAP